MKNKLLSGLMGLCALGSVSAIGDEVPALTLGDPKFIGDGCTKEDTEIALTDDKQSLSILFSKYAVKADKNAVNDRRKCDVRIPVRVPAGLSISIITSEFRGFNFLPRGATAILSAEYFLVGKRGPQFKYQFPDPTVEDSRVDKNGVLRGEYYRKNDVQATALVWGPCGKDTTIAIKSSLDVSSNSRGDQSNSSLDSLDLTTKTPILYKLTWRKCNN